MGTDPVPENKVYNISIHTMKKVHKSTNSGKL